MLYNQSLTVIIILLVLPEGQTDVTCTLSQKRCCFGVVGLLHASKSCLEIKYRRNPVSAGNMFQDLPRLRETAENTERCT